MNSVDRLAAAIHDLLRGAGFQPELTAKRMSHQIYMYVKWRNQYRASQLTGPLHERFEPHGWGRIMERAWTELVLDTIGREEWDSVLESVFGTDETSEWADEIYLFLPLWARRSLDALNGFSGAGGGGFEQGAPHTDRTGPGLKPTLDVYLLEHGSSKQKRAR